MAWRRTPRKMAKAPVHKKGNIKDCGNYRGINLLNSGYKIYANIIKNKLYTYYRNKLGDKTEWIPKQQPCSNGYFTLKILIEKHREFNFKTHTAFLDFKNAFDRINR